MSNVPQPAPPPAPPSGLHLQPSGVAKPTKPPTPKAIAAQSESRNSFARIVIGGGVLFFLCIILAVAVWQKSENVKDVLLVISALGAYILGGRGDQVRQETK